MAAKHSILIVEDDLDLAEMLNAYFRVQGYEVMTAAWGEDAVQVCQQSSPNIVLLDIRLPDIDGYEVCRRLRALPNLKYIPILFLTERRRRDDRLQGLELGAVDFITKPFDIQELRLRVRNAIGHATQESLLNPVTGLPDSRLVDEQLDKMVGQDDIGALAVSVRGLNSFRADYGFVAADDVLRAISVMVVNAGREAGQAGDFIGHITDGEFLVVTASERLASLRQLIETRVERSLKLFYPVEDRSLLADRGSDAQLSIELRELAAADGPFANAADLRAAILERRKVAAV